MKNTSNTQDTNSLNVANGESGGGLTANAPLPGVWVTFKEAASFSWKNFWRLLGIVLPFFLSILILDGIVLLSIFFISHFKSTLSLFVVIPVFIAGIFIYNFFGAALLSYIFKKQNDAAYTLKAAYKNGWKLFWPFVWISILLCFVIYGFSLLLIIPGIVFGVYLLFSVFALVVDDQKGFDALFASYAAIKGSWWRTVWYFVFAFLMFSVFYIGAALSIGIITAIFIALFTLIHVNTAIVSVVTVVLLSILGILVILIVMGFLYPFSMVYTYLVYRNLKQKKAATFEAEFAQVKTRKKTLFIVFSVIGLIVYLFFIGLDYRTFSGELNGTGGGGFSSLFQSQIQNDSAEGFEAKTMSLFFQYQENSTSTVPFVDDPSSQQQVQSFADTMNSQLHINLHYALKEVGQNFVVKSMIGTSSPSFYCADTSDSQVLVIPVSGENFSSVTDCEGNPLSASSADSDGSSASASAQPVTTTSTIAPATTNPASSLTNANSETASGGLNSSNSSGSSGLVLYTDSNGPGVDIELPAGWTHRVESGVGSGIEEGVLFYPPGQNPTARVEFIESNEDDAIGTASNSDIMNYFINATKQFYPGFTLTGTSSATTLPFTFGVPAYIVQGTFTTDGATLRVEGYDLIEEGKYSYILYLTAYPQVWGQYQTDFEKDIVPSTEAI